MESGQTDRHLPGSMAPPWVQRAKRACPKSWSIQNREQQEESVLGVRSSWAVRKPQHAAVPQERVPQAHVSSAKVRRVALRNPAMLQRWESPPRLAWILAC